LSSLSSGVLVGVFLAAAVAIWLAGVRLADATDALDRALGIGDAFGGLILLAFVTNLPEIAITASAASGGHLGLAVGNLVGGVAIQTAVLAFLDLGSRRDEPLTFLAASLLLVLEATGVMVILAVVFMGTRLPASTNVLGASPASLAIAAIWVAALLVVRQAQRGLPWKVETPAAAPGRSRRDKRTGRHPQAMKGYSTRRAAFLFALGAAVTLAAGVLIEQAGDQLAGRMGLQGAVFGATFLAAATALPELSTGLASVRIGDNQLAFSDIFGGNAFLPVLFLMADLLAGTPSLPSAARTDQWMAGLGILLTGVYAIGLVMRPRRKLLGMGPDSLAVLALYALGIGGLLLVPSA
jgi:cation:H+ antiporter